MLDVSPERVHVTYQGYYAPERISDSASTDRFLNGLGLTRGAYALFVGAIEPKKNVGRLIHAYRLLRCDIPLLLVGRRAWLWQKELRGSRDLIRSGRVKIMEYVPRQVLNELYRGARFFVFPSIYEGFGLPPIEAMAHDCPVLVSNAASLPEVCGEAAIYCDPFDIENIAGQMELLLNDDSVRDSLIAKGRERLKMFSAERYQERLLDAYNAALGHRR